MATTSYPAVGIGGLTDVQWAAIYGNQDGLIEDYVGTACTLSRLNSSNICRVSPGRVSVNGYVLDITADEDLYCAPVVTGNPAVTYYISALYDPALNIADSGGARSAAGPCRLVITTGVPDTTGGKSYVLLYTVQRSASQLLADSNKVDYRRWIGVTFELPDYPDVAPTGFGPFPRGSLLYQSDIGEYSLRGLNDTGDGLTWLSQSRTVEYPLPVPSSLVAVDTAAKYYRVGSQVTVYGTLKRSTGADLSTGSDVILATMPVGYRPGAVRRFQCVAQAGGHVSVRVFANGSITMTDPGAPVSWIDLSSITYRAALA